MIHPRSHWAAEAVENTNGATPRPADGLLGRVPLYEKKVRANSKEFGAWGGKSKWQPLLVINMGHKAWRSSPARDSPFWHKLRSFPLGLGANTSLRLMPLCSLNGTPKSATSLCLTEGPSLPKLRQSLEVARGWVAKLVGFNWTFGHVSVEEWGHVLCCSAAA